MSAILAAILDFSKILFYAKIAANFTEISRKHVFSASNRNIVNNIESRKKKLEQIFLKNLVFYFEL